MTIRWKTLCIWGERYSCMRLDKNKVQKELLKERYYFLAIMINSICISWRMNTLLIFVWMFIVSYIVRGFISLVYMVQGVESYNPAHSFGPFFFPGDEQYIKIQNFLFCLRISPICYYVVSFLIGFLLYIWSLVSFWLYKETSLSMVVTNSFAFGFLSGTLKNGIYAHIDYQANMVKAKQMFLAYQGDVDKLSKMDAYRQMQVSKYYENIWRKELHNTNR